MRCQVCQKQSLAPWVQILTVSGGVGFGGIVYGVPARVASSAMTYGRYTSRKISGSRGSWRGQGPEAEPQARQWYPKLVE